LGWDEEEEWGWEAVNKADMYIYEYEVVIEKEWGGREWEYM
jgi:hypothetical protein